MVLLAGAPPPPAAAPAPQPPTPPAQANWGRALTMPAAPTWAPGVQPTYQVNAQPVSVNVAVNSQISYQPPAPAPAPAPYLLQPLPMPAPYLPQPPAPALYPQPPVPAPAPYPQPQPPAPAPYPQPPAHGPYPQPQPQPHPEFTDDSTRVNSPPVWDSGQHSMMEASRRAQSKQPPKRSPLVTVTNKVLMLLGPTGAMCYRARQLDEQRRLHPAQPAFPRPRYA